MLKKELIRKAAIKVIAREGFHNAKVQTIADEAGVANGTVYIYFKNKQEILDYIYKIEIDKKIKYLTELSTSNDKIYNKIDLFLNFYFKEWESNLDVLKITVQESMCSLNYSLDSRKVFDNLVKLFSQLLKEGFTAGEIKEVDFDTFSYIIFYSLKAALYKFKFYECNENTMLTEEYEFKKTQLISFILDGIKK